MITIANTNKISTAPQLMDESTVLTGYILHNIQFLWACALKRLRFADLVIHAHCQ